MSQTAQEKSTGRFVTFEGGEGVGKTSQARRLADTLRALGHNVILTREPGGSAGAEEIRRLLVEGSPDRWDVLSEFLLHFAARRDHLVQTVWPALKRGDWVVCDRFADSTLAYQCYTQGFDEAVFRSIYKLVVGNFEPDLTLILDVPAREGLRRAVERDDGSTRYENMDIDFHERLHQAFLRIGRDNPRRCIVLDAQIDETALSSTIFSEVEKRLINASFKQPKRKVAGKVP